MLNAQQQVIHITPDEKEKFLTGNPMPEGATQAYIWFAFQNSIGGVLYLFADELPIAAVMAQKAGLTDLAKRLDEGVRHDP